MSRDERIAQVTGEVEKIFANPTKADRWLRKPSRALGGDVPLSLLETEAGTERVREELIRIAHGIYT